MGRTPRRRPPRQPRPGFRSAGEAAAGAPGAAPARPRRRGSLPARLRPAPARLRARPARWAEAAARPPPAAGSTPRGSSRSITRSIAGGAGFSSPKPRGAGTTPAVTQAAAPPAVPAQSAATFASAAIPAPRPPPEAATWARVDSALAPCPGRRACRPATASWRRSSSDGDAKWRRGEGGDRAGDGAVGAHRRAAVGAGAQVLEQDRRVLRARLPIAVGGEDRPQLGAAVAALTSRDQGPEPLTALGQAAIHFGPAESGQLADLRVGVALGEQGQGTQLRRLQGLQRLAAAGDGFVALDPLCRAGSRGRDQRHPVDHLVRLSRAGHRRSHLAFANPADGERLVLGHGLHPADQLAGVSGRGFDEEDLERALEGVLSVLDADRVAASGPPQRSIVLGHHFDRHAPARRLARQLVLAASCHSAAPPLTGLGLSINTRVT